MTDSEIQQLYIEQAVISCVSHLFLSLTVFYHTPATSPAPDIYHFCAPELLVNRLFEAQTCQCTIIVDLITKLSERLTGGQHIQCGNTGQRHTPWPKRKGAG